MGFLQQIKHDYSEKSLKALLCNLNNPVPFTHSIELILDRLPKDLRPGGGEALIALTDYAMIRRC